MHRVRHWCLFVIGQHTHVEECGHQADWEFAQTDLYRAYAWRSSGKSTHLAADASASSAPIAASSASSSAVGGEAPAPLHSCMLCPGPAGGAAGASASSIEVPVGYDGW